MPIRFGSPLFSKLNRRYWEFAHVKDRPLVFAVADFHADQSMLWSGSCLYEYLFGLHQSPSYDSNGRLNISSEKIESHRHDKKEIPSGFFYQENAKHVRAGFKTSTDVILRPALS